jgi:hypothetical protein
MRWWDERTLAPLFEVNERLVQSLPDGRCLRLRGLADRLPELRDAGVRNRLARCPFLLVDVGLGEPDKLFEVDAPVDALFSREEAVALTRMTFVLAWSLARMDATSAGVVLGISPRAAATIAALRLEELYRAAQVRWWSVKPRWADRPQIWRRLARGDGRTALPSVGAPWLRASQLLFWECVHQGSACGCLQRRRGVEVPMGVN